MARNQGRQTAEAVKTFRAFRRTLYALVGAGALLAYSLSSHPRDDGRIPVHRVIDGDTIELADGRLVRYIGIDTPETRRRVDGQWVDDPEPFGKAATDANRRLVQGKTIRLEQDVQSHDRYGRLLAYVYVTDESGQEHMVNAQLLQTGMGQLLTIPPNVKYVELFRKMAREAREAKRGLWAAPGKR